MTLRKSIERYQRVMAASDDPAHASIAAALREILSDQIGGDAVIDVEQERMAFEAWHYSEYPNSNFMRTADGRYLHYETAHRLTGWLAAKRDAAIPEDAIAVLANHCIDDPKHGNVPEIMQWLKANDPEAYGVIAERHAQGDV